MNLELFLTDTCLKTVIPSLPLAGLLWVLLVETCILGSWNPLCPEVIKTADHLVLFTRPVRAFGIWLDSFLIAIYLMCIGFISFLIHPG